MKRAARQVDKLAKFITSFVISRLEQKALFLENFTLTVAFFTLEF